MSDFKKFNPTNNTGIWHSIFMLLKETFAIGAEEFSKTIWHLFYTSEADKHQITRDLELREMELKNTRL